MRPNAKNRDINDLYEEILSFVTQLGEATAYATAHGTERPDVTKIVGCLKLEAAGRLVSSWYNTRSCYGGEISPCLR